MCMETTTCALTAIGKKRKMKKYNEMRFINAYENSLSENANNICKILKICGDTIRHIALFTCW